MGGIKIFGKESIGESFILDRLLSYEGGQFSQREGGGGEGGRSENFGGGIKNYIITV